MCIRYLNYHTFAFVCQIKSEFSRIMGEKGIIGRMTKSFKELQPKILALGASRLRETHREFTYMIEEHPESKQGIVHCLFARFLK